MSPPPPVVRLRDRCIIGASLLPPVALLMLAARAGWVPVPVRYCLMAMPLVMGFGMLLPSVFEPWHRWLSRGQSWLGRRLVFLVLLAVYGLALVPIALLMRWAGQRPVDLARSGSSWVKSKGHGSLRDPF